MPENKGQQRVRVFARLRPSGTRPESESKDATFITEGGAAGAGRGGTCIGECDPATGLVSVIKDSVSKQFRMDAFLPQSSTQEQVYDVVGKEIVHDVLRGYNGTIFAYGQTGTGKTHTMMGPQWDPERDFGVLLDDDDGSVAAASGSRPGTEGGGFGSSRRFGGSPTGPEMDSDLKGLIPRALDDVFGQVSSDSAHIYEVTMSYVQIYCELVHDLLNPGDGALAVREDGERGVFIENVATVRVNSTIECMEYMRQGNLNRATASTRMNAHSSRSHAVLMVNVERRDRMKSGEDMPSGKLLRGQLFLVDLAGSERAKKSGVVGMRLEELKAINLSLAALGNCISALAIKRKHIPYRDSKLTRLLQGSLGGNAKTALVVNICPEAADVGETVSTLQFGQRARKVQVRAVVNERVDYKGLFHALQARVDKHEDKTTELNLVIQNLRGEVAKLKDKLDSVQAEKDAAQAELRGAAASYATSIESMTKHAAEGGELTPAHVIEQVNKRWEEEIERLKASHEEELQAMRARHEESIKKQQELTEQAADKAGTLELETSTMKDDYLDALTNYRKAQEEIYEMDSSLTKRVSELMADLEQARQESEEAAEELAKSNERIESAERAMKKVMDKVKNDFVSRKQVTEMEALYEDTINKLLKRVEALEEKNGGGPARSSSSGGERRGGGRGVSGVPGASDTAGPYSQRIGSSTMGGATRRRPESRERMQREAKEREKFASIPGVAPHLAMRASKRNVAPKVTTLGPRGIATKQAPPPVGSMRLDGASARGGGAVRGARPGYGVTGAGPASALDATGPSVGPFSTGDDEDMTLEQSRAMLASLIGSKGMSDPGANMKAPSSRLKGYS